VRLGDRASRFLIGLVLIGLVTCFATHDGIPRVVREGLGQVPT
jgi:hypothetical protein